MNELYIDEIGLDDNNMIIFNYYLSDLSNLSLLRLDGNYITDYSFAHFSDNLSLITKLEALFISGIYYFIIHSFYINK